jgi:hypothetical protein
MSENDAPTNDGDTVKVNAIPGDVGRPEAPEKVSYKELEKRVEEGTISEEEMNSYFIELEQEAGDGVEPIFVLDPARVELPVEELMPASARLMNTANAWCMKLRHWAYHRRINKPGGSQLIRVIAEGDSWFQYPIKLHDVIDHIIDRKDVAVLCFSAAGDVLSNMVQNPQFLQAIKTQKPSYFLLSGGGNDMVKGPGLRLLLNQHVPGLSAAGHLNDEYRAFKGRLKSMYTKILKMIHDEDATVHIICHGYSNTVPKGGHWLGEPMQEKGIQDAALQLKIMNLIVDDLNEVIAEAVHEEAARVPGKASFVDNRGVVPPHGWKDEFHPTSEWFGVVTRKISALIK